MGCSSVLCSSLFMWDDLDWPPPSGCGTQHPHRALGGTCVLLAAAPTTPPCFRHWRRSSLLHFAHIQRKNYFIISEYRSICGRSGIPFSREGLGTNSLSQSLTALPAPSRREPLMRPGTLHFIAVCVFNAQATSANCISQICRFNRHYF